MSKNEEMLLVLYNALLESCFNLDRKLPSLLREDIGYILKKLEDAGMKCDKERKKNEL